MTQSIGVFLQKGEIIAIPYATKIHLQEKICSKLNWGIIIPHQGKNCWYHGMRIKEFHRCGILPWKGENLKKDEGTPGRGG